MKGVRRGIGTLVRLVSFGPLLNGGHRLRFDVNTNVPVLPIQNLYTDRGVKSWLCN